MKRIVESVTFGLLAIGLARHAWQAVSDHASHTAAEDTMLHVLCAALFVVALRNFWSVCNDPR